MLLDRRRLKHIVITKGNSLKHLAMKINTQENIPMRGEVYKKFLLQYFKDTIEGNLT